MNDFKLGKELRILLKRFTDEIDKITENRNISSTQFHILNYLFKQKTEDITQKDLCDYLKLSAPTISITLNNMETEDLIKRTKSKEDSRKTLIGLTLKGTELAKEYKSVFKEADNNVLSRLSFEEKEEFILLLTKLNEEEKNE